MTGPILLHGVAWAAQPPTATTETALEVEVGRLAAIVSPLGPDPDALSDPDLAADWIRRQDRILTDLTVAGRLVVPARFGTCFSDVAALRDRLTADPGPWLRDLEALDGHAEWLLALHASPVDQPPPASPAGGRDYLRLRRDSRESGRRAAEAAAGLRAKIVEVARGQAREVRTLRGTADRPLAARLLLAHRRRDALVARLGTLAEACAATGQRMVLSGPFPPYAFCDRTADEVLA